jgi:hypothetical protein
MVCRIILHVRLFVLPNGSSRQAFRRNSSKQYKMTYRQRGTLSLAICYFGKIILLWMLFFTDLETSVAKMPWMHVKWLRIC